MIKEVYVRVVTKDGDILYNQESRHHKLTLESFEKTYCHLFFARMMITIAGIIVEKSLTLVEERPWEYIYDEMNFSCTINYIVDEMK